MAKKSIGRSTQVFTRKIEVSAFPRVGVRRASFQWLVSLNPFFQSKNLVIGVVLRLLEYALEKGAYRGVAFELSESVGGSESGAVGKRTSASSSADASVSTKTA